MSRGISKKTPYTLWLDNESDDIISHGRQRYNLKSKGEVVIHHLKFADMFLKNLDAIKTNPELLDKAMLEMDEMRKQEKFGIYFESLSHEQREAFIQMIRLIDEGQWTQTRLI